MRIAYLITAVVCALPAFAQRYEFGVNGGVSLYNKKTITNSRGSADAGFKTGYAGGISIGHNMYEHVGGEIRYTFLKNDMRLESGSAEATFGAQAHLVHYDFLIHAADTAAAIRPYVAFGAGFKQYRGTGTEQLTQPLSNIGLLTKTTDFKPMVSVGGGVKIKMTDKIWLRFDVHDYLTEFPTKVIAPASGSSVSGWIGNIVGTGGITFTF
ncbi:MAG TPA: outer membrane beta-barrel protein [Bryobacteraceae bacterium]|nr:outer membrane beta-barrel protein [Bryobacteraceae bacterium]